MSKKDDRFIIVHREGSEFSISRAILVDRETGVNYLMIKSGYGAGITPLLDSNGQPVVSSIGDFAD